MLNNLMVSCSFEQYKGSKYFVTNQIFKQIISIIFKKKPDTTLAGGVGRTFERIQILLTKKATKIEMVSSQL